MLGHGGPHARGDEHRPCSACFLLPCDSSSSRRAGRAARSLERDLGTGAREGPKVLGLNDPALASPVHRT